MIDLSAQEMWGLPGQVRRVCPYCGSALAEDSLEVVMRCRGCGSPVNVARLDSDLDAWESRKVRRMIWEEMTLESEPPRLRPRGRFRVRMDLKK